MSKVFIKFDDEEALESGLPVGVTHETDGDALFSIAEDAELPEGARLAEPEEYADAESAAAARLKVAQIRTAKRAGLPYEGVLVPFTSDSAMAFVQVKLAFIDMRSAEIPPDSIRTNMMFADTGTILPVSLNGGEINVSAEGEDEKLVYHHKFADVSLWFSVKRNSFYQ